MSIPISIDPLGTLWAELPPGYVRLAYLESYGSQYIDTLQSVDDSTKWEAVVEDTRRVGYQPMGIFSGNGNQVWSLSYAHQSESGPKGYMTQWWDNSVLRPGYDPTGPVTLSLDNMNAITRMDELSAEMTGTRDIPNGTLYLFARNRKGALSESAGYWRIWHSRVWKGGNLVQNLIPALDPDGKPCMFDTVSREPFYNKGTGEFRYA